MMTLCSGHMFNTYIGQHNFKEETLTKHV